METFVRCTLVAHVTHIAPVCAAVKAYTAAFTACAVVVYKAGRTIGTSLAVLNVTFKTVVVITFTAFTTTFVATPAVFAKLTFNITNTAVYTVCAVIHSTFNAHIAVLTPGVFTFSTIAADNTFYSGVINKAQITAGACHVIISVTFKAYMVLSFTAFAVTFVAYSAIGANSVINLTSTAFGTMALVFLCTFNTHMTFVTPGFVTFYATFTNVASYYFVVNIAQTAVGAHHILCKMTFIAYMVLSLTAFTAAFITASAIYTNSVINLTSTALIAMTFVVHRTGTAHMALFAPIVCTASALTAVLTMVFLVAVSSAFLTTVVATLTDVAVPAESTAELTVNLLIPCV